MPVPVYASKSSTGEQFAASFVPAVPAGTTSGDLLVACCWMISTAIDTPPVGWTSQVAVNNGTIFLNVFTKIAGASESVPTFEASFESYGEVIVYRLSGVDAATPVDVSGSATGTLDAPSVTTTVDDDFVLHLFGSGSGFGSAISVPAGDTVLDTPSNFYATLASGHTTQATAGATGAATFDDGAMTSDQVTATLAIAPPAAAPVGGIVLERGLQHFWPLSNLDGSDVWAGDAFDDPPPPTVGSLANGDTSPHGTLGSTRLTNDGSVSTAVWQATSATFNPDEYTFAGWMRPVYPDVVQKGFQAGIDPSRNNIGGVTRHSDNAKTYGLDGSVGVATRNISPSYEYGNWQFVCVRVSATDVTLNVDADAAVTGSRGTVRSAGSVNWRLYVGGNGASISPVEYHGWGVWDRVLSDEEVAALHNGGTAIGFPLLTNGETATALTLAVPGDMTPRLLPQGESLVLAADSVVSPVLPGIAGLTLQPAAEMTPPVLPSVTGLTLHSGHVASPSLPVSETLTLDADRPVSPVVPTVTALTLQGPGDVTPPVLPAVDALVLQPTLLGPELPEVIAGLQLASGELGPVLPSASSLVLAAQSLGSILQPPQLALAAEPVLFGGLTTSVTLTLAANELAAVLPPPEPLSLRTTALAGGLLASEPLVLTAVPAMFAGLASTESLTLAVGHDLLGPNDLSAIESLTLTVAASLPDPRLLAGTQVLTLASSDLPGTLRTPVLTLQATGLSDAPLLTVPRRLMLRADRFVTHSFERVNLISLRSRRANLQSLTVTN